MAGSRPNLHTMVPSPACIQDVLKVKVEVKGHVIGTHLLFHENRFFSRANGWPNLHKLFAIQYGFTFCLYMRSLYEAPLHSSSSINIRQLDLMSKSKSWNELLRHWRSSSCSCFRTNSTFTPTVRQRHSGMDGRTDGRTTYCSNTARCT